jgi:hypothetical protein
VYREELKRMEVFKYLGRFLAYDDNDARAVKVNLCKAQKCWAWVSKVLKSENAPPHACGMFYKATVQAVLMFGSETWNILIAMLARLEGLYIRAEYRIVHEHKPERMTDGWDYPSLKDVLEGAGLYPMQHYVQVRCNCIAAYIVHRSIFDVCRERGRKCGSRPCHFWWDQPMELDGARDAAEVKLAFGGDGSALL